jgi:hypothetical protein
MIVPMATTLEEAYEELRELERHAREKLLAMCPMLPEAAVAALNGGSRGAVRRWRQEGRIFAVQHEGEDRYPAFQFENGEPKKIIAEVLEHLSPADPAARSDPNRETPFSDWAIAFWFASANAWLDEGASPVERMDAEPEAVVEAASHARDKRSD